ncbi:MAG: DNA-processing protein DprA [Gemmataceae bacterium]|nr:DNA-processing protein DprA [Gemmataceae bacterium]
MVPTQLSQEAVHPDTQAVLLLCAAFAKAGGREAKPLTLREYNALALWLVRQGRRPADLLKASEELLPAGEPGLPPAERVRALLSRGVQLAAALERWQRLGLWVISRGEDRYPERLRRNLRSGAPALLYGAGDWTRLTLGGVALVGSRVIDEEALCFTRRVAERCAGADRQVVSGGARGVDQAAVLAALDAGGGAVAVLADRLDRAATSRAAKEPLRRGRLTLATPYEPESGFTVGRAMGRNKCIYALADCALVVRFARGEGGTWAGAVEQLAQNQSGSAAVPVFVRVAHNPEDGWRELCAKGALPFPEEEFWTGNVVEVFSRAATPIADPVQPVSPADSAVTQGTSDGGRTAPPERSTQPEAAALAHREIALRTQPPAPSREAPAVREADTCYSRCLPLLLQHLREEPGQQELDEIAKRLEILPKQIKEWLERAIAEGKVKRKKKGRRSVYVDALLGKESDLFDRGGDAA